MKIKKQKKNKVLPRYSVLLGEIVSKNIRYILGLVMTFALISIGIMSGTVANLRTRAEVDEYNVQVEQWVLNQKNILEMFVDSLEAQGDLYKDYDATVAYLDDITKNYEEISCTYLSDPSLPTLVIMNNGWMPDAGFDVAARSWYSNAIDTDDIAITEPYLDEQTGGYCITFSKRVEIDGQVIGVFGIDFYMDKLTSILAETYSDQGYAFLVDNETDTIITHPSKEYQLSAEVNSKLMDTNYSKCTKAEGKVSSVKDYDSHLKTVTKATSVQDNRFSVFLVKNWMSTYGALVGNILVYLFIFGICLLIVDRKNKRNIEKWFRPLEKITEDIQEIAKGNLSLTFEADEVSVEIKVLQESLNTTIKALNSYVGDITRILESVADGDLTVISGVDYEGDFVRLQNVLQTITGNLNILVKDIDQSAKQFKVISNDVLAASSQVEEGAATQAENINSLAGNMDDLQSNMRNVNDTAQSVIQDVEENSLNLKDISDNKMDLLYKKMKEIEGSSNRIVECLEIINGINAQTNLLALNASIEAARAGDAGKGFAVVADEIRGLSDDTTKASQDIDEMIKVNNRAVEEGLSIMENTVGVLKENLDNFMKAKDKIGNMAEVIEEQEAYISKIVTYVDEIEGIVKSNTDVSKNNYQAAEQMAEQSDKLNAQIDNFVIKE